MKRVYQLTVLSFAYLLKLSSAFSQASADSSIVKITSTITDLTVTDGRYVVAKADYNYTYDLLSRSFINKTVKGDIDTIQTVPAALLQKYKLEYSKRTIKLKRDDSTIFIRQSVPECKMRFSKTGKYVCVYSFDGFKPVLAIYNTKRNTIIAGSGHQAFYVFNDTIRDAYNLNSFSFAEQDNKLLLSTSRYLYVFDLKQQKMILKRLLSFSNKATFALDGKAIILAFNNEIRVFRTKDFRLLFSSLDSKPDNTISKIQSKDSLSVTGNRDNVITSKNNSFYRIVSAEYSRDKKILIIGYTLFKGSMIRKDYTSNQYMSDTSYKILNCSTGKYFENFFKNSRCKSALFSESGKYLLLHYLQNHKNIVLIYESCNADYVCRDTLRIENREDLHFYFADNEQSVYSIESKYAKNKTYHNLITFYSIKTTKETLSGSIYYKTNLNEKKNYVSVNILTGQLAVYDLGKDSLNFFNITNGELVKRLKLQLGNAGLQVHFRMKGDDKYLYLYNGTRLLRLNWASREIVTDTTSVLVGWLKKTGSKAPHGSYYITNNGQEISFFNNNDSFLTKGVYHVNHPFTVKKLLPWTENSSYLLINEGYSFDPRSRLVLATGFWQHRLSFSQIAKDTFDTEILDIAGYELITRGRQLYVDKQVLYLKAYNGDLLFFLSGSTSPYLV